MAQDIPSVPPLKGDVHVWHCTTAPDSLEMCLDLLSVSEKQRAHAFGNADKMATFICARAMLRRVLASYLHCGPSDIVLDETPRGKPILGTLHNPKLSFNLSHSAGQIAVAITKIGDLGIDIEAEHNRGRHAQLIDRFFADEEKAMWHALPLPDQKRGFFQLWTLKEAVIKATGLGLGQRLDSFCVDWQSAPPQLLWDDRDDNSLWHLESFQTPQGLHGAVALRGPLNRFKIKHFHVIPPDQRIPAMPKMHFSRDILDGMPTSEYVFGDCAC